MRLVKFSNADLMKYLLRERLNGKRNQTERKFWKVYSKGQDVGILVLWLNENNVTVDISLKPHASSYLSKKLLRFAIIWARQHNYRLLRILISFTWDESRKLSISKRTMLEDYCLKLGFDKSPYYYETVSYDRETMRQQPWVAKQLRDYAKRGYAVPEGYEVYRYSELTEEQREAMRASEKANFAQYVCCFSENYHTTEEYSFAAFKDGDFAAYVNFTCLSKTEGKFNSICSNSKYPQAGLLLLKRLVCIFAHELTDMQTFHGNYILASEDGRRLKRLCLGDKWKTYTKEVTFIKKL